MNIVTVPLISMYSVFESFNIVCIPNVLLPLLANTTASFYVLQCVVIISFLLYQSLQVMTSTFLVESVVSSVFRAFYVFIYSVLKQQLNVMQNYMVPHIYSIALFILVGNVGGLLPYGFSVTSFPGVTLVLSSTAFFSCIFLALLIPIYNIVSYIDLYQAKYLHFLSFFAPHDVPTWLYPLIISIEIISFFFRLVALGFRLAANLMAGHILLGLLAAGYCGLIMSTTSSVIVIAAFTLVVGMLLLFELFVSFLQTYVFVVLLSSYYNDIYSHFDIYSHVDART